tara:strand:- start:587 stop:937 length:351 start_codon:yes stop_codon:yes gene_type:complete
MSDLFPEYLREYFDQEKIDFADYETKKFGRMQQNGWIFLSSNDTLEDQILSLLHEVVHMHPQFMSYTGGLWEGYSRDEKTETSIEEHAKLVYEQRPDIVDLAKETLRKARTAPKPF